MSDTLQRRDPRSPRRAGVRYTARCRRPADSSHLDVCLQGIRREGRLRLHAFRQSNARCARRSNCRSGRRRWRCRHCLRHGGRHACLQLLNSDDLLVAPHDCYGGTYRLFDALAKRGALRVEFVDQTDDAALDAALAQKPKLVWVETPSNPLLRIVDIRQIAAQGARARGAAAGRQYFPVTGLAAADRARRGSGAAFDHEVPERPQRRRRRRGGGSDRRSCTSNWCGGRTASALRAHRSTAISTLRGLRTLYARLAVHGEQRRSASRNFWTRIRQSARCSIPGCSHPQHELAKRQQSGFGAMVSFELKAALPQVRAFLDGLSVSRSPNLWAASRAWSHIPRA